MAPITPVSQLSGSEATSLTSHRASSSAIACPTALARSLISALRPGFGGAQRTPDRLRPDWQGYVAHPKMPERIDDGVRDGRRGPYGPALAAAFRPQRIAGRRRHNEGRVKRRKVIGPWQRVIHEAAGKDLPRTVINDPLGERLADALREPAVHLTLDNHRVDHHSAVIDRKEIAQRDRSSLGIDEDDGKVHALRVVS